MGVPGSGLDPSDPALPTPQPHPIYNPKMAPLGILFVCIGNTCRSPMAEAMARAMGGDRVRAYSAGLNPTGRVARETIEVLDAFRELEGGEKREDDE